MGPTQSISTQTAGAHAAGNISLGNVSVATGRYDTLTANKSNVARENGDGKPGKALRQRLRAGGLKRGRDADNGERGGEVRGKGGACRHRAEHGGEQGDRSRIPRRRRPRGSSGPRGRRRMRKATPRSWACRAPPGRKRISRPCSRRPRDSRRSSASPARSRLRWSWDTAMVYEAGARAGTSVGLPGGGSGGPSLGAGIKARGKRETDVGASERYEEAREFASSSNSRVNFSRAFSELEGAVTSKQAQGSLQFTARDSEEARAELRSARSSLQGLFLPPGKSQGVFGSALGGKFLRRGS